ncbi:DUF2089 domain-containing protein [Clostridium estertheticum]|nr:DUF2089 domain-containing protein [Clostridium estertheticum]WLC76093.1 DUF2089 domain-containing protein [Clostridium estertheticum]
MCMFKLSYTYISHKLLYIMLSIPHLKEWAFRTIYCNIKDVEKELGISYPTVRGKLEDLIASLGYTQIKEKEDNSADVIDKLEKGEITAEQALNLLRK